MTGLKDRFVLGCAQIGGLYQAITDEEAWATLEAAWAAGVRRFDTAPHYGAGLSERRLGSFLSSKSRSEFVVSTKVGRLLVPTSRDTEGDEGFFGGDRNERVRDYSWDGVRRSLEASLTRLGLDRVDAVYVHDPDDYLDAAIDHALPSLVALREEGMVGAVGAGMNRWQPLLRIVEQTQADQIMLAGRYTVLDRSAEADLLPACVQRGVDVVAAGVFNSGLLADPRPGATYDYGEAGPERLEQALALQRSCESEGVPLRAAAIQFPLRHPAVKQVAVGCRGPHQVDDAVAGFGAPVPESVWTALELTHATLHGGRT